MKHIQVTVAPDGESKVEAFGFSGNACRSATDAIRKGLGFDTDERLKADFHQAKQSSEQQARNG